MRRLRRDASICSSGTDRSFPERTPPGFARRSPRDRRYGAARPAKAIERPRVPQSFFSLAPLAKSRRFPRTPLSAERHARRKTAFSAERDKEFGGVVDDAGTDRRCRKRFRATQNLHAPFTLSRLPASTLRAARMLRPESSASFFVGSDVMPHGGKREDKAETAEFFFDGHELFSEEDSTPESREEDPPPFSFLWRSRRPKNTGGGDIRHAESGDESDRRVSLNVLPDPARCLAGSDYQARN